MSLLHWAGRQSPQTNEKRWPSQFASTLGKLRYAVAALAASAGLSWVAPAGAVPGLVRVESAFTASNSSSPKSISIACPAGLKVFGTGAVIDAGVSTGQVYLDQVFPNPTLDSVTARAVEEVAGFAGNWALRVQAICGNPAGLGLHRVKATASIPIGDDIAVQASCPLGEKIYGTGFALHDQAIGRIFPSQAAIDANGVSVLVRAVTDSPPINLSWDMDALAICGLAAPGYELKFETGISDSLASKSEQNSCGVGKKVHGIGWSRVTTGSTQRDLITEDLDVNTSGDLVRVKENDATNVNWRIDHAIVCAN
jgi:hypothetical protein